MRPIAKRASAPPRRSSAAVERPRQGRGSSGAPRAAERPPVAYKVVEVSPVSEETLEETLNDRSAEGWSFESLHFVSREGSHRPALAYLFFVQARR